MGGSFKHGGHVGTTRFAAGTASALFTYEGETLNEGTIDWSVESLLSVVAVFGTGFSGASTSTPTLALVQKDVAGVTKNLVTKSFAAGVNATAWVPIDITNAVAGTGVALTGDAWKLAPGDTVLASTTNITSDVTLTWKVGSLGT